MGLQFGRLIGVDFAIQCLGWAISSKLHTEKHYDLTGKIFFIVIHLSKIFEFRFINIYLINISKSKKTTFNSTTKYSILMCYPLGIKVIF